MYDVGQHKRTSPKYILKPIRKSQGIIKTQNTKESSKGRPKRGREKREGKSKGGRGLNLPASILFAVK